MMRIIISATTGIVVGLALAYLGGHDTSSKPSATMPTASTLNEAPGCDSDGLRRALSIERDTTQSLLQEIARLEGVIERLSSEQPRPDPSQGQDWLRQAWAELDTESPPVDRRQQLVNGGFDAMRADWIVQRESELERAVTKGTPLDHVEVRLQMRQSLRAEIGDFEYEQYLAATGQSTAVAVSQVLPDSAAAHGGLKIGDEIIDYDGVRVFNVFELSDAAGNGSPGEFVVVNIERGGSPMQLVLPRGSLGISAGGPIQR